MDICRVSIFDFRSWDDLDRTPRTTIIQSVFLQTLWLMHFSWTRLNQLIISNDIIRFEAFVRHYVFTKRTFEFIHLF